MNDRGSHRELAGLRWPELGDAEPRIGSEGGAPGELAVDLAIVPFGATEQHGPHLPFDTDTVIASAVARRVADRLAAGGLRVVVAPAVPYGASWEHQAFPGTSSVSDEVLNSIAIELARSVRSWAGGILFINGHGGNLRAIAAAVTRLRRDGVTACWAPCATADADPHAGRTETSIMLHLAPERVLAEAICAGETESIAALLPRLREIGVRAVSPNGVLGDARGASAAEGAMLLEEMVHGVLRRCLDERMCEPSSLVASDDELSRSAATA